MVISFDLITSNEGGLANSIRKRFGYAAYRINIYNSSTYKYIKLWNTMFMFTTNCGMQYEPLLGKVFNHLKYQEFVQI